MGDPETTTMRFSLLTLTLVCATLATVNGEWFKISDLTKCNAQEAKKAEIKTEKPSPADGEAFCVCRKDGDNWAMLPKCVTCEGPCADGSGIPLCNGKAPVCSKTQKEVTLSGCGEEGGHPECKDKSASMLCKNGEPPKKHQGRRR